MKEHSLKKASSIYTLNTDLNWIINSKCKKIAFKHKAIFSSLFLFYNYVCEWCHRHCLTNKEISEIQCFLSFLVLSLYTLQTILARKTLYTT